jgi:hypothetical protein
MWRSLIALFVLVVAWMVSKDALVDRFAQPSGGEPPAPPEFASTAGWAARPAEEPPGGWEKPWGVDVFLLLPPPRIGDQAVNLPASRFTDPDNAVNQAVIDAFSELTPVYAPAYRAVAPAAFRLDETDPDFQAGLILEETDIIAAFEHYLETDNRFRGVLIVAYGETSKLLRPLEAAVLAREGVVDRTVGYVAIKAPDIAPPDAPLDYTCMAGVGRPCLVTAEYQPYLPFTRFLLPQLPVRALPEPGNVMPAGLSERLEARIASASAWLDANATKPAPPLPPLEAIEISPIKRPGEED